MFLLLNNLPIPIIQGTPSSSASKIDLSVYDSMAEGDSINISGPSSQTQNTSSNINTSCMYMITNIKIFLDLLQLVGRCLHCSSNIDNTVDFSSKKGLAQKLIVSCEDCNWNYSTYLSTSIKTEQSSRYDVNVRSIIAFREIGRGLSHIETFNRIMNMPPPYTHSTYDETVKDVLPGYIAAMNDSMLGAACNVKLQAPVQEFTEEDTEIPDNQDESDILLHNNI